MELSDAIAKLERLPERAQKSAANIVANEMRRYMHEYGMTPDGETYAPYVPRYKRYREKHNRSGSKVDLKFTGEYGRDIRPRKDGDDIIVAPKESDLPRAEGLSKKRPHIGVGREVPGIIEASWNGILESL